MNPIALTLSPIRAVKLLCKAFCVFFLFYAVANFIEIPSLVIGLMHYRAPAAGESVSASYYMYWTRRYALWITAALVRGGVELWLARVFYRVGPRMRRFFLGDEDADGILTASESEGAV
jgi:hypothetical protein